MTTNSIKNSSIGNNATGIITSSVIPFCLPIFSVNHKGSSTHDPFLSPFSQPPLIKLAYLLEVVYSQLTGTVDCLPRYQFVEVWLDYVEEDPLTVIKELEPFWKKIVFTMRKLDFSETRVSLNQYKQAILFLTQHTTATLDLDVQKQKQELDFYDAAFRTEGSCSLITSFHNFSHTPSDPELNAVIISMRRFKPYIYKIATWCNSESDALRLLDLGLSLREQGQRYITLGMGSLGAVTRIFGSLWGNALCFAPETPETKSAPGQFCLDELKTLLNLVAD
jgi:3-dehydroquinate dehydratase type I